MIGLPAIRFIPKETQYDVEGSTNEFTVQLNLGDPPTSSSTSSKKRKAEEEPDKDTEEPNKIRQKVRKLCEGDAEAFIRWNKQLDTVIKDKPCESGKSKFSIVSAMLYGDLADTWSEYVTSVTNELRKKKKTDDAGLETIYEEKGARRTRPSTFAWATSKRISSTSLQQGNRRRTCVTALPNQES